MIGVCTAVERSCPQDATGVYPKCLCNNFDFIFNHDACVKVNRDECPPPAIKIADRQGCRCPDPKDFFDDYYWFCRTKLYLPLPTIQTSPRPTVPHCPAYHHGVWPDCVRIPCGKDQPDRFVPNCAYVTFKPTTYIPGPVCPEGQLGVYPQCQWPCPPHTAREYNY